MLAAGHPVVAVLLGLGAAGLGALMVAMAWNIHVRQFRLAELLARRQFTGTADPRPAADAVDGNGDAEAAVQEGALQETARAGGPARPGGKETAPPVVIEGPDTVVTGEQARYRAKLSGGGTVVSWAVGGGAVSQSPDPDHPDELLLTADQPGSLTVIVRVRKGLAERRATKAVVAEAQVPPPAPPFTLRLFLQGWSLAVIAILVIGFAGALVALGSLSSADFVALAVPLTALLVVAAVLRSPGEAPERRGAARGQYRTGRPPEDPWYWPSGRAAPAPVDAHAAPGSPGSAGSPGGQANAGPAGYPYPSAQTGENANHN
ncbi:MAG: hypothetical protein ACLPKE_19915 [Streptosporangiaceae bacterium]